VKCHPSEREGEMASVTVSQQEGIATVTLQRGKVNALNEVLVGELLESLEKLESDAAVRAVILTGAGKFFSFGFDIPEFLGYEKSDFERYLRSFTKLCSYLFTFPKPVIAAVNGHAVAGGCMLATACDYRIMATGKARIALNEITFGASVFAGSVALLRCCAGHRNAERILFSGAMYSAEEARQLGLADQCCPAEAMAPAALKVAREFADKNGRAFQSLKGLLRGPVAEEIRRREDDSIREFVDIWYSDVTWKELQEIKIHS
jgi:enoyl-CoA hydratase/carnithine racemase